MKTRTAILFVALLTVSTAGYAVTVEEVLENNAKAMGGREVLDKIKTVSVEGKVVFTSAGGDRSEWAFKRVSKAPDKAYSARTQGSDCVTEAVNGKIFWRSGSTMQTARATSGARAEQRLEDARIDNTYMAKYLALGVTMELLPDEKVGDREACVLKMTRPYGTQTREYIDKQTWLLLKETSSQDETLYSDWRKVGGVMCPFKLKSISLKGTGTIEFTINSYKINSDVPDSLFEFPSKPEAP